MTDKEIWDRFMRAQEDLNEQIKLHKHKFNLFTHYKLNSNFINSNDNKSTKEQQHVVKTRKEIRSKT